MTTDLQTALNAALARWDTVADEAARKLESSGQPAQGGFYAGMMFGMESARDELAVALANLMMESTKS